MEAHEHRMIESLAYCIYLAEGCPEERALQHWLEAEKLVEAEEQFEAESSFESNTFDDETVQEPELAGVLVGSSLAAS